jgi:hypothetical protein
MAKLVKCSEQSVYPTWTVVDDNAVRVDVSMDLGTIYFDGHGMVFDPESESGAHHTADHLREIAELMDDLEAQVTGTFERQLTAGSLAATAGK